MYCSNCGDFCSDELKYCKNCGYKLVKNSYKDIHDFSDLKDIVSNENQYNRHKKKSKKSVVPVLVVSIIFLILLVVVFMMMLIYGYFHNHDQSQQTVDTQAVIESNENIKNEIDDLLNENSQIIDVKSDENKDNLQLDDAEEQYSVPKKEWQKAYANYLKNRNDEGIEMGYEYGDLIYVNNDNVPELALYGDCEATGCLILTYYKGKIDALYTNRLDFDYIKKGNLLRNTGGHMDYYFDFFYSIKEGKWEEELAGTYGAISDLQYNKDGTLKYDYEWDGNSVTESEYNELLNDYYKISSAKKMEQNSLDNLYKRLDSSDDASLEDDSKEKEEKKDQEPKHRYDIIIADVTWTDAEKACKDKGGYLVSISSEEEFKVITNQIIKEGKESYTFYVGATRDENYVEGGYQWIHDKKNTLLDEGKSDSMWLVGEPSYEGRDSEGNSVSEKYVDMFYRESEKRCYFNDVTNDIIIQSPSHKGRIGYICEYDE